MTIRDLEPKLLWSIFDEITQVPRPSKKEEKIRAYLLDFAKKHGIEAKTDAVGNVAMRVPATKGKEGAPTIVLQGHMDMVPNQTKPETHNFETDPILTEIDGEWCIRKTIRQRSAPTMESAWRQLWLHWSTSRMHTGRLKRSLRLMKKPA